PAHLRRRRGAVRVRGARGERAPVLACRAPATHARAAGGVKDDVRAKAMNTMTLLRGLRRSPRLSLAVVACIALGMAATAAVATLIDLTTFRAPRFPAAERFVRIWNSELGTDQRDLLAFRDVVDLRGRLAALDALESAAPARLVWHRSGDIGRRVEGEAVSAGYFDLLGVRPYIGRMISPEEHARGDAVLLLSYATWGREFGYDE